MLLLESPAPDVSESDVMREEAELLEVDESDLRSMRAAL